MAGRYASGTTVPHYRSQGQIEELLSNWGALGVQWTTSSIGEGGQQIVLRFVWEHDGVPLSARFDLKVTDEELTEMSRHLGTGRVLESKLERNRANWAKESMRLLYIFLKGALHAVDEGLITAEQLFMPWFEDRSGRTFGEAFLEHLADLPKMNASKLLESGRRK